MELWGEALAAGSIINRDGRMLRFFSLFLFFGFLNINPLVSSPVAAASKPNIENYGQLPKVRAFSISPDGRHFAYVARGEDNDLFYVLDSSSLKVVFASNITNVKARATEFITNKHVLIRASDTLRTQGYKGRREHSGALVYNLETGKVKLLLKGTRGIHPAQTGLGRIVGMNPEDESVFMPAFAIGTNPRYNLYKVNLNTGKGRLYSKGNKNTIDWFMDAQGNVLAREEYDEDEQLHSIHSRYSGQWQTIYSLNTSVPKISVQSVAKDGRWLLFIDNNNNRNALFSMDLLDGEVFGPEYESQDAEIDNLLVDINRQLQAVIYSGFKPSYEFVEQEFNQLFDRLALSFPSSSVHFESWNQDKTAIIILVSGGDAPGTYYLFDTEKVKLKRLVTQYDVDAIGEIKAIRYPARDGLKIPALLTLPPGDDDKKNLPLIALPHGGPESYDQIGFDWMAQYFAAKGYAVLQPNFRGSTGFGNKFRLAGYGRWGAEMQNDVSDGIAALAASGYIDPERVCIIGGSYGGYSALAGGAYSPELYRCIVSINGVSDLPRMLKSEKRRYGKDHWVVSYWSRIIGNSKTEIDKLKSISPVHFAADFKAPVLLLHGRDDTVVPIKQSDIMYKALRRADKSVELIRLKGEDHWLSSSATRLQLLTEIDQFLDEYNPVRVKVASQ